MVLGEIYHSFLLILFLKLKGRLAYLIQCNELYKNFKIMYKSTVTVFKTAKDLVMSKLFHFQSVYT